MATFADIRAKRTTRDNVHESVYRSYHILDKVVELLDQEVPHVVIVEIVADLRDAPDVVGLYDKD